MSIRVDEQLKKSFDLLCDQFGLSNSAALNLFMKAVVRERKIPFEIKADSELELRQMGWEAFMRTREQVAGEAAGEMSLGEMDALMGEMRNEKKQNE